MGTLFLDEVTNEDLSSQGLTPHDIVLSTDSISTKGFTRRLLGSCISPVVTPDFIDLSDYPSIGRYRPHPLKCELVLKPGNSKKALAIALNQELSEEECQNARAKILDSGKAYYIKAGSQSSGGSGIVRCISASDGYRFESDSHEIKDMIEEVRTRGDLLEGDGSKGEPRYTFLVGDRNSADAALHKILLSTRRPLVEEEMPFLKPYGDRVEARGYFIGSGFGEEPSFLTTLAKVSSGGVVGNVNSDLPGGYYTAEKAIWHILSALVEEGAHPPCSDKIKEDLEYCLKLVGNLYATEINNLIKSVRRELLYDNFISGVLDLAVDLGPIWDDESKTLKWGLIEIQDRPALVPEAKAIMDPSSLYKIETARTSYFNNEGYD